MKLLTLLLLLPLFGIGQKKDSVIYFGDLRYKVRTDSLPYYPEGVGGYYNGIIKFGGDWFDTTKEGYILSSGYGYYRPIKSFRYIDKPVYDTVPCLIQYSDTARIPIISRYKAVGDSLLLKEVVLWGKSDSNVYWMKGYEVLKVMAGMEDTYSYDHIIYLDDKRKPLSKNIIVWMAK